jgi:hypothetical protein
VEGSPISLRDIVRPKKMKKCSTSMVSFLQFTFFESVTTTQIVFAMNNKGFVCKVTEERFTPTYL